MIVISETLPFSRSCNFARFGCNEKHAIAERNNIGRGVSLASGRFVDCNYVQVGSCTKEGGGCKKGSETKVVGIAAGNRMNGRGMTVWWTGGVSGRRRRFRKGPLALIRSPAVSLLSFLKYPTLFVRKKAIEKYIANWQGTRWRAFVYKNCMRGEIQLDARIYTMAWLEKRLSFCIYKVQSHCAAIKVYYQRCLRFRALTMNIL